MLFVELKRGIFFLLKRLRNRPQLKTSVIYIFQ